jgi:hypothetical protein
LNMYFYLRHPKNVKALLLLIQILIMLVISVLNDNKMFLFTLSVYLIIFIMMEFSVNIKAASFKKIFWVVAIILLGMTIVYFSSEVVKYEINNTFSLLGNYFEYNTQTVPDKHNERAYLNYLAFNQYNGNGLGIGLATFDITNQTIHTHLGINSFSIVIISGGLLLLFSILNLYTVLIIESFSFRKRFSKTGAFIAVFCSLTITSIATQLLRDHYIIIMISIIFLTCYLSNNNKENVMKRGI